MKGLTPKKIKAELDNVHSTLFVTVYNWVNEFKRGRTSTCDALRSGRPIEAATPEIIDKVHDIVLIDRRVSASLLKPHGTVISILHEQLDMKKLSEKWVPRLLTVDHKITVDETWIHYFTPETKEQSKQWTSPSEPAPKKAKIVEMSSAGALYGDCRTRESALERELGAGSALPLPPDGSEVRGLVSPSRLWIDHVPQGSGGLGRPVSGLLDECCTRAQGALTNPRGQGRTPGF
ncbi:SETMR methyltransferase, partial [Pseudoatta argentina]